MGSGQSKLPKKIVQDLGDATHFSDEEIQEWYKAFRKECPSGQMTLPQFLSVWQDLFVSSEKKMIFDRAELEKYGKEVFRSIDKDSSGSIDFREFLVNVSIETRGSLDTRLQQIFNLYDLDKDGYVTKTEMNEFIKIINKAVDFGEKSDPRDPDAVAEQLAHKIFWKLDRNKDGRLTLFEFISGVQSEQCLVDYFLGERPDATD